MGKEAEADQFHVLEIAELTVGLLRAAGAQGQDIGVQIAALRSAAEVLTQALTIKTLATQLANLLNSSKPS